MNIELANRHNYFANADAKKVDFWVNNMAHWLRYYGPYDNDPKSIDYFCNIMLMFHPKMLGVDPDIDNILSMIIRQFLDQVWAIKDKELAFNECLKVMPIAK